MNTPLVLFFKSHIDTYTRKNGSVVTAHDDKRKKQDPALDPERIQKMAAGRAKQDKIDAELRAADAPRREANYQNVLANSPEFEMLDGVEILRTPGSDFAAFPATGKRNSRVWQVFKVKTREEVCQLKKDEVRGWLVKVARD